MTKFKRFILLALIIAAVCVLCLGITGIANAEIYSDVQTEESVEDTATDERTELSDAVEKFKSYLKDRYGADYDYYYNQIIDGWGSIEEYLLSFGDKLPEEYKTGWDKFVGWLSEYSVVWAPALAVAIVILVAVIGKKAFNSLVERIVNAKLSPIVNELNLQSSAMVAMMHSQRALLGTNDKFVEVSAELEKSEKELVE